MKRRRGTAEVGSALVEFAIGWSVLWLVFSAVYSFGYTFYIYNALMTLVANAAQLGSKLNYDLGDNGAAFRTTLQNMVLYGDETVGTNPTLPGLSPDNVSVTVTLDTQSIPRYVTIMIDNYTVDSLFRSTILNGKPRATTKYVGEIYCSTC